MKCDNGAFCEVNDHFIYLSLEVNGLFMSLEPDYILFTKPKLNDYTCFNNEEVNE